MTAFDMVGRWVDIETYCLIRVIPTHSSWIYTAIAYGPVQGSPEHPTPVPPPQAPFWRVDGGWADA